MTGFVQVIFDRLAGSLYFRLGGYFRNADTPPVFITSRHRLGKNLHVNNGGNGLLLRVLNGSLQLIHSLDGVGLAAVCRADSSVVNLHNLALVMPLVTPSSSMFFSVQMQALP